MLSHSAVLQIPVMIACIRLAWASAEHTVGMVRDRKLQLPRSPSLTKACTDAVHRQLDAALQNALA